jgi:hypothetical protein
LHNAVAPPAPTDARDGHDVADAHRQRVHDSAQRALNQDADLIQRLREDDAGDGLDAGDVDDGPTAV